MFSKLGVAYNRVLVDIIPESNCTNIDCTRIDTSSSASLASQHLLPAKNMPTTATTTVRMPGMPTPRWTYRGAVAALSCSNGNAIDTAEDSGKRKY